MKYHNITCNNFRTILSVGFKRPKYLQYNIKLKSGSKAPTHFWSEFYVTAW